MCRKMSALKKFLLEIDTMLFAIYGCLNRCIHFSVLLIRSEEIDHSMDRVKKKADRLRVDKLGQPENNMLTD